MFKRIAFTIVFNGKHHLEHNNHIEEILPYFDHWVFAEGFSMPVGSTSWCKDIMTDVSDNGSSIDGTLEFLIDLKRKYPDKITIIKSNTGYWKGKDVQVNACIDILKSYTNNAFLWEFDVDEHWTIENIIKSETMLKDNNANTLNCKCNFYVGDDLIVQDGWGGDCVWVRLWNWNGETFSSHEPPILNRNNIVLNSNEKLFNHYAYYFEKDVEFKSKYYGGHENVFENWKTINMLPIDNFPIPVSRLFGNSNYSGIIVKEEI